MQYISCLIDDAVEEDDGDQHMVHCHDDDVHEDDGDDGEKHLVHCLVTVRLTGTC